MRNLCKIQSVVISQFKIVDSIETPSGEKMPCISGKASHTDVISQKGYRYRKGFWPKVINSPALQSRIESRDVLGMIEHPKDDADFLHTPYDKAAVICLRAWCEGEDPYITLGLLNNPQGNAIKALVEVGHRPGVSTRAFGDYAKDDVSSYIVDDGFTCIGWDVVRSPNFEDIRMDKVSDSLETLPEFRELMQMTQLRDSVDENYNHDHLRSDIDQAVACLKRISNYLTH